MTDRQGPISSSLVGRAKAGDEEAMRVLVEATYPLVHRWALVHSGDPSDASDLAQDVMIKVIQNLDAFHGDSKFESWVYSLTRNAALDRHRRERRIHRTAFDPRALDAFTPARAPSPDREVEREQLRALLLHFFQELPARQREVFDLVELQGLAAPEAAEILGLEAVSVRAHLFKARRKIRALMLKQVPFLIEELSR